MNAARLQQAIAARIREAQALTEGEIGDVLGADELRLVDLLDGVDRRAADVLAWAARSVVVFDAVAQVAQAHRLREALRERGVEVCGGE